jgi:hypothetical protein
MAPVPAYLGPGRRCSTRRTDCGLLRRRNLASEAQVRVPRMCGTATPLFTLEPARSAGRMNVGATARRAQCLIGLCCALWVVFHEQHDRFT